MLGRLAHCMLNILNKTFINSQVDLFSFFLHFRCCCCCCRRLYFFPSSYLACIHVLPSVSCGLFIYIYCQTEMDACKQQLGIRWAFQMKINVQLNHADELHPEHWSKKNDFGNTLAQEIEKAIFFQPCQSLCCLSLHVLFVRSFVHSFMLVDSIIFPVPKSTRKASNQVTEREVSCSETTARNSEVQKHSTLE